MRGEEARRLFFNDKSLGFTEGYELLTGGGGELYLQNVLVLIQAFTKGPHVNDADPTFQIDESQWLSNFNRRLQIIRRRDRLHKSDFL